MKLFIYNLNLILMHFSMNEALKNKKKLTKSEIFIR